MWIPYTSKWYWGRKLSQFVRRPAHRKAPYFQHNEINGIIYHLAELWAQERYEGEYPQKETEETPSNPVEEQKTEQKRKRQKRAQSRVRFREKE